MPDIPLWTAFGAGLSSFLLPCVLPLVPVYIASLYGPEIFDSPARKNRVPVFLHALSFVVGFSVIFATLGAIAGFTGFAINPNKELLSNIAGGLLIAFGALTVAAQEIPQLNYERHLAPAQRKATGYLRSFFIGAIIPLAWIPCVGGILGGILTLAAASETASSGAFLLTIYALGLGLPFLIIGAAFDAVIPLLKRISRFSRIIQIISGFLLIALGIVILTIGLEWLVI
jgi:cytochrome c-type biogenesis protein